MYGLESLWKTVDGLRKRVDSWVAGNVTPVQQTYFLMTVMVVMVIHLVYTRRRVRREMEEQGRNKKGAEELKKEK